IYDYLLEITTMIRQWEEAGVSLANALQNYLRLCISLNAGVHLSRADKRIQRALGSRLDSALNPGGLHAVLTQQLAQSCSVLTRTRNRILASPIYSLPGEILSEIFLNVIYDYPDYNGEAVHVGTSIRIIYQRLHQLLGVCSSWRKVGISYSALWSFVPWIHDTDGFSVRGATKLSLQRASGTNLYLAAILPPCPSYDIFDSIAESRSRFRAINITTEHNAPCDVERFFTWLLKSAPRSLSEVSLCLKRPYDSDPAIMAALNLKQRFFCSHLPQFTELLGSLSKIRLSGAGARWDKVTFSDRLVELRLEAFVLGHKSDLDVFLTALASASELQDLSLISITTFPDVMPETAEGVGSNLVVSLPHLKTLHIADLYFNALQAILGSITQGPHRLTLILTINSVQVAAPAESDFEEVEVNDLCEILSGTRVDTLVLCGKDRGDWLDEEELGALLRSIPSVKTLRMSHWNFRSSECRALQRLESSNTFPKIDNMHLCWAGIIDQQGFKDMVSSHSIQQMVLGGYVDNDSETDPKSLQGGEELVVWLKSKIPDFQLYNIHYEPPGFGCSIWRLW
ncbi:hypothetical protein FRC11_007396, partial [Ceratobasidium sp. 423]